ncbi:MAG: glutathione synthase [Sorangiineae bacterium NIC37A_2]|jgi:glutathione synthase|nr:MAG: glutathione synthase [Sorangiineae bacterium NIC37A_2]
MRFLFVMDPAHSMLPDKDTSFAFMEAAKERGHQCYHCLPAQVGLRGKHVTTVSAHVEVQRMAPAVKLGVYEEHPAADFDAIFIRKDPPFDAAYLALTQVLDLAEAETFVLNHPRALRDANEKLLALHYLDFMPETIVTSQPSDVFTFVDRVGEAVMKPLDGAGGSGVVRLSKGDKNVRALTDLLTGEGKRLAMVQRFEPAIKEGDKRVLLLDGELLGVIRRVPQEEDFRANIHVGGRVEATDLTPREKELVQAIGPSLRERGLWFVGLDLIAEKLIEINVTSPTGIQELARLTASRPAHKVIEFVERQAKRRGDRGQDA